MSDEPIATGIMDLPRRTIPLPASLSAQAQAFLKQAIAAAPGRAAPPSAADKEGWRRNIAERNIVLSRFFAAAAQSFAGDEAVIELGSTLMYHAVPSNRREELADAAFLEIHGGAFVLCNGRACQDIGRVRALGVRMAVYSVDYRMPPDHPYPAPLDDCIAAYRWLLDRFPPDKIVVGGVSAGGNLAAAMVLRARDEKLPLPRGLAVLTPELDLTESGDSFQTNRELDVALQGTLAESIALYADGHDLADPYLSPLFGDFAKGFPETFITAGTRDLFLSNAVRLHRSLRRSGVEAALHVFEGMPHGGFMHTAPEDAEVEEELSRFVHRLLAP